MIIATRADLFCSKWKVEKNIRLRAALCSPGTLLDPVNRAQSRHDRGQSQRGRRSGGPGQRRKAGRDASRAPAHCPCIDGRIFLVDPLSNRQSTERERGTERVSHG